MVNIGFYLVVTPSPLPPISSSVSGFQKKNNFGLVEEFYNTVNWTTPSNLTSAPVSYQIYRDLGFTQLAGTVPANTLTFLDHDRAKGQSYTYYIVAVAANGAQNLIGYTRVTP